MAAATVAAPEGASRVPSDIIIPPRAIREAVDKTAGYVARNGIHFETRIREKNQNNVKFSFLDPNDEYYQYYQWMQEEVRQGRGTDAATGRTDGNAALSTKNQVPQGPPPPPEFRFSARMPNINAQDLEVVQLTALYVAKKGRGWMTQLLQKEANNFQFEFLRTGHSLYPFFTRLVDQYSELLNNDEGSDKNSQKQRVAELQAIINDRHSMLEKARQRAQWAKHEAQKRQEKDAKAEEEKRKYAEIDWHDFRVIETIVFNENDENMELPPPTSLGDLQSASLEQKAMMSMNQNVRRIEEAMPTDDDFFPAAPQQAAPPVQAPMPLPTGYPMPPPPHEADDELAIRERQEARDRAQQVQAAARGGITGQMRIKNDYVPRAQAKRQQNNMALCPNCKQQVPIDELEAHMKIELLDPAWREQRAKAESRNSTTNLSTQDVANNLKRLASQRTDVFDPVTGQQIPSPEEEARRKRVATAAANALASSGVDASNQVSAHSNLQGLTVEEQIRHIHERAKQ